MPVSIESSIGSSPDTLLSPRSLEWTLRIGAFLCFVGHGAFGIIGKEAWLPYFAVAGIGPATGRALEPWIGTLDVVLGCLMLARPRMAIGAWMALWATWTALLRPLAGEPFWEALERAGNYGVPAALVLWMMFDGELARRRIRIVLQGTVALLMIGHGALGVIGKHGLVVNLSSVLPAGAASLVTPYLGWLEILLALAVLVRPSVSLLVGIAVWELATESLFITAGAPFWEVVERGGSYAAPIALTLLLRARPSASAEPGSSGTAP